MKLQTKLLTFGVLLTAVPLLVVSLVILRQNSQMVNFAETESTKLAYADPIISTVIKGEAYRGRAMIMDKCYIASYEPIFDSSKKVSNPRYKVICSISRFRYRWW